MNAKKPSKDMFQQVERVPTKQNIRKTGVRPILDLFIQNQRPAVANKTVCLNMRQIPTDCLGRQSVEELEKDPRPLQVRITAILSALWGDNKPIGTSIRDSKLFMFWTMDENAIKDMPHLAIIPEKVEPIVVKENSKIDLKISPKILPKKSIKS